MGAWRYMLPLWGMTLSFFFFHLFPSRATAQREENEQVTCARTGGPSGVCVM